MLLKQTCDEEVKYYTLFQEPLPPVPLSGMLNKHGGKVRLTFKPEQDQLWLGTKERTEKLAMTSIKSKFFVQMNTLIQLHRVC